MRGTGFIRYVSSIVLPCIKQFIKIINIFETNHMTGSVLSFGQTIMFKTDTLPLLQGNWEYEVGQLSS